MSTTGESRAASARIGRWLITAAPAGWFFEPGFGLRHNTPHPASNITVKEDSLLAGTELAPYVEAQKIMLARTYDNPTFAGPQPATLLAGQVDESMLLLIRHQTMRGATVMQVQTYVRQGKWLGIITLTTVAEMLPQVRSQYEQFVASLTVAEEEPVPAATNGGVVADKQPT